MTTGPLRVLLVEDDENDALLILGELRKGGWAPVCRRVQTKEEMLAALDREPWDVILADYSLPHFSATAALDIVLARKDPGPPFIVVSGHIGEDAAVELIRKGAQDYLLKDNIRKLSIIVKRELEMVAVRKERKRAGDELVRSEAQYRSLFDNMLNGFAYCRMIVDENDQPVDCTYLAVNRAFEMQTGLKDVVGKNITQVIPGIQKSDPELLKTYGRVARTGITERFEVHIDFLQMWFDITVYCPGKDHFVAVFDVITERKKMEARTLASEARLLAILDVTPFPIALVDRRDDQIVFWSKSAHTLFGHTAPTAAAWYKIAYPDPAYRDEVVRRWKPALEQAARSGGPVNTGEYRVTCRDGSERLCEIHAVFLPDGIVVIFVDITERKLLERSEREAAAAHAAVQAAQARAAEIEAAYQALKKAKDLLIQSEKMNALGMLSAGVAHELNNPLTGILGIARHRVEKDPEGKDADLRQIVLAGERMSVIIRELLDFSRPSSGEKKELNCNDIIAAVLDFGQKVMLGNDVVVHKSLAADLPLVYGDKNKIVQVVTIIVGNAVDAMDKKGVLGISSRAVSFQDKRFVEMEFTDSGSGIKKEDQPRLFEPFFTTKKPGKGTGLGLAIAASIIKDHHGEIFVASPPAGLEHGTSFKVRLPVGGLLMNNANASGER